MDFLRSFQAIQCNFWLIFCPRNVDFTLCNFKWHKEDIRANHRIWMTLTINTNIWFHSLTRSIHLSGWLYRRFKLSAFLDLLYLLLLDWHSAWHRRVSEYPPNPGLSSIWSSNLRIVGLCRMANFINTTFGWMMSQGKLYRRSIIFITRTSHRTKWYVWKEI